METTCNSNFITLYSVNRVCFSGRRHAKPVPLKRLWEYSFRQVSIDIPCPHFRVLMKKKILISQSLWIFSQMKKKMQKERKEKQIFNVGYQGNTTFFHPAHVRSHFAKGEPCGWTYIHEMTCFWGWWLHLPQPTALHFTVKLLKICYFVGNLCTL